MKKSIPTRPNLNDPKTKRLQIVASDSFVEKLDLWRGKQRDVPNRSEAIRRLCERNMDN